MGDRNNPIKFGPEWLRNMPRERSAAVTTSSQNSQGSSSSSATATTSGSAAGATASSPSSATASSSASTTTSNTSTGATARVQLAKLRYGREEMLALYDRTSEAPTELKYIDFLYQPRGKPPIALNNNFEEEMSATRSGAPMGPSGERFGTGRGMGRIPNSSDARGRSRMPFVRQASAGRSTSWHLGASPRNLYNTGADEESPQRSSWSTTNGGNITNRTSGEQTDWNGSKVFRSKRQGPATNWRQAREGSDEWRSPDTGRNRNSNQQDKWERDWGDRPNQDKQPWNSNRRTWVGSDSQNNDDLPEWAMDGTEACGGTFDSSGAFHGYSNDDTNLPKNQDSSYPLARSHTHGSFARSKTVEEGSDEWWASEKAKKLSPKRFDASDIKFKKLATTALPASSPSARSSTKPTSSKEETVETPEKTESAPDPENSTTDDGKRKINQQFSESKTFDALMRSDIDLEEANDERGNFQSVMITPNNSLRQKHQNIVSTPDIQNRISTPDMQNRKPGMYHMLPTSTQMKYSESDYDSRVHSTNEDKIVEEIMDMTMEDKEMLSLSNIITTKAVTTASMMMNSPSVSMPLGMPPNVNSMAQMTNSAMHMRISSPLHPNQGMTMNKPNMPTGMQGSGLQTGLQQTGITNSALNASLGLPIGSTGGATMGLSMQGIPPPLLSNSGMANPGMGGMELSAGLGAGPMQGNTSGIPFPTGGTIPGLSTSNLSNNSLFLNQNTSNNSIPNHGNQGNIFPMHGLQHSGSQAPFITSMYGNMMQSTPPQLPPSAQSLSEQWYYEDPKKTVQGPFSSNEMYNWYRAGFFTPSLMVRRACDTHMMPLGSFGSAPPFAQPEMMSPYPMSSAFEPRSQVPLNSQPGLVLESVDSLWSPPSPAPDMLWMQQGMNVRNENRVNNLPMFFWDQQPTAMTTSTLLPEDITKEMKTEDQILAQIRATHSMSTHPNIPYMNEPPPPPPVALPANKPENFPATDNITPKLEELQKLMQKDMMMPKPPAEPNVQNKELLANIELPVKLEQTAPEHVINKSQQQIQHKIAIDPKVAAKQAKNESEKSKNKDPVTKSKTKKAKEDKKEETEVKNDEEFIEKRSAEPSPSKTKKEEKANKKELEKEKKEWLKDGFTIVKGSEKNNNKESKKKAEEAKATEEAERKRKEDDKLAAEEEKKRKQIEALKKQQELQQQQRQIAESVVKKAPWSVVTNQSMLATTRDGLTLAEIQRLEREKKLEQMKEQQQMMQIIAQQQAAALAREQEMQAGLGWAKKKGVNALNMPGQSLAEIQAEARKQQAVAAAGAAAAAANQVLEEAQAAQQAPINLVPWGNTHNGGFWDTQPNAVPKTIEKQPEPAKMPELKPKKKPMVIITPKKESSPAAEFETWCTSVLASFSSKIDVPTFVGFLKDIESPYEVKDYVKCYLGESKDSGDFARQFLERRSKLLRVGMVTPSDDLCSPAIAVNPRTISGSDYQEVKGKGKKTKKNRMLKVDARILGFSVTASEDRINVGDIDTV